MPSLYRRLGNNIIEYEHRIIASKILNRPLKDGEVVHHIDKDKSNNDESNLMIFKTAKYHSMYHGGFCNEILQEDGSYICEYRMYFCDNCKKYFREDKIKHHLCIKDNGVVEKLSSRKIKDRPTKEELLFLLKNNSFLYVSKMYGVSDNAIRKWCKSYGLSIKSKDYKL